MKVLVMYCVMVGHEIYPDSLSHSRAGAESYLRDAKRAAAPGVRVYVAKVAIEAVPT